MPTRQVFIGIITEGTTDSRFLEKIIERTFIDVAYECSGDIEPVVTILNINKIGLNFVDYIIEASRQGVRDMGMMVLCAHCDADSETTDNVINNKFLPAKQALDLESNDTTCKILVQVIPVQMIEAWMLADKELLKEEIGTNKSNNELGINRDPEMIADPKSVIEKAIRIAREDMPKRRRKNLKIGDLYLPLGQKISKDSLCTLNSYNDFQEEVREAYRKLHLLR